LQKFADFKITVIYAPELRLFHCHYFITPVKVFNEIYTKYRKYMTVTKAAIQTIGTK